MKTKRTLTECWLWLGIFAVAVAGLYALVPVIGRTPQLKSLNVMQHFFDVALVIHVDLSVLVWFLAIICMGASTMMARQPRWPYWEKAGFFCVAAATLLMAFSPFGPWVPVKSNYIPVLHNLMFLSSLGLLVAGLILALVPCVVTYLRPLHYKSLQPLELVWVSAAMTVLFALGGYGLGAWALPEGLDLAAHYEQLFWVGGHMMQFAYTLLVMGAWLALLHALGGRLPSRTQTLVICVITMLGALVSMAGFILYPPDGSDFTHFQTRIMIEWGGVGATLMGLLVLRGMMRTEFSRPYRACASALIVSLFLFFAGGVLGLMIQGQNVTIPAHYHGMITGITQALMGLAYLLLPNFGYQSVTHTRLAFWQPIIYGIGQTMHIGGLAYCGGYGILRKTAGGFADLAPDIKIALGIFGFGGLLAITGGVMFVVVMLRVRKAPSASLQPHLL